ncbi:trigger factor [Desulfolucanica intricata]|uniref:trigger factor n=1 Tax=Desulfolucanica intricata TaxID=1285191 RepID=UPI000835A6D9|nr:trigger factor [Desulfolucanica intricata]
MKATADRIEKNTVLLEVEVDSDQFSKAMNQAYRKVVKSINIPGFRKGKAPKTIVERYVGKEVLYNEAMEIIVPKAYIEAVEETKIEPIDQPQVELVQVEEGKPVIFKATVAVKPEIKLGQYTDLELTKPKIEVSDEDVQKELENLQNRHAKLINLDEGQVKSGDIVSIDFTGRVDGEEFEGGQAKDYSLEIGSGSFIAGFEEQVEGMSIGETKDINVTFPEDYHVQDLASKPAVFTVTVNGIKRKELAPLDDEFAKDVSEFDTLEELRGDLLNKLKQAAENKAQYQVNDQAIAKAVENAEVEIPEVMIKTRINDMIANMERRLMSQGISIDDYLTYTNSSKEQLEEQLRPEAEKAVKISLVLEAIAKAEGIEVSDEEIDQEMKKMGEQYQQDPSVIRKILEGQGQLDSLIQGLLRDKTVKLLVERARVIEDSGSSENKDTNDSPQE